MRATPAPAARSDVLVLRNPAEAEVAAVAHMALGDRGGILSADHEDPHRARAELDDRQAAPAHGPDIGSVDSDGVGGDSRVARGRAGYAGGGAERGDYVGCGAFRFHLAT